MHSWIRQFSPLCLCLGLCFLPLRQGWAATIAAPLPDRFPHEGIDLPRDTGIVWDRLANGIGWAFLPNEEPAGKLSIRLFVHAGSMQETEAERGIAHYLEHMAFNGSENFPPGTVVELLQERGIGFGSNFNAHTGFLETVYKLDLPDLDLDTLAMSLKVMADTAGFLTLPEAEIDKERGVILAELRDRDNASMRWFRKLYAALYPGMVTPERFPIGLKERIEAFDHEAMASFYRSWYRTDRLFLAIVGDIDREQVAPLVETAFDKVPASPATEAAWTPGVLQPATELVTLVHHDPELQGTSLRFYQIRAEVPPDDSLASRQLNLLRSVAARVLQRRFADLAESDTAPILGGNGSVYAGFDCLHGYVSVTPKPGQVPESLTVMVRELRRFLLYGPTQAEIDVVRNDLLSSLEQAVDRAPNRTNAVLATSIYQSVRDDKVFGTPAQTLELYRPWLADLEAEAIRQAFARGFADGGHRVLALAAREELAADIDQSLAKRFALLQDEPVSKPVEEAIAKWAYAEKPAMPEDLGKTRTVADHGIVHLAYGNQVRVNLLARDAKPNDVRLQLTLPADPRAFTPGRKALAGSLLAGGLGKHDARELRRVLSGAKASVSGPGFAEDAVQFSGSCLPGELALALQWMRAVLLDSAWAPEAFQRTEVGLLRALEGKQNDLAWNVGWHWSLLTDGGLTQRRGLSLAEARALDLADTKAWLQPILQQAPVELAIVGDIDLATAEALVDQWFGSLPQRQPLPVVADLSDPQSQYAKPPLTPAEHRFTITGSVDRSVIRLAWPTDDTADIFFRRRMSMLARVVDDRLRKVIREELGEAYSPYARHAASLRYNGDGYVMVNVSVAPDKVATVLPAVQKMIAELLSSGVDEALLDQVKVPAVKSLGQILDGNGYWLGSVTGRSQSQPQSMEWAKTIEQDYAAISAAEITELARRYLTTEPLVMIGTSRKAEADPAQDKGDEAAAKP